MYVHTRYRNLPILHRRQPDPLVWIYADDAQVRSISDDDETIKLWDVQTGEKLREFVGNKAWHIVNDLAFSPDGRYALLGGGQYYKTGRVTLWDVDQWTEVRQLGEHEYPVRCVAFSPDGRRAVSGSSEGYVRYLDIETGRRILSVLREINRRGGVSLVTVTHNAAIGGMGDRVLRMRSGEIVSDDRNEHPIEADEVEW